MSELATMLARVLVAAGPRNDRNFTFRFSPEKGSGGGRAVCDVAGYCSCQQIMIYQRSLTQNEFKFNFGFFF